MPEPSFQFEVITPDQTFYQGNVVSLVLPGMNGFFGVLANHAPLIARSSGGRIKIRETSQAERFVTVEEGIFEVLRNRAVFLTKRAQTTPIGSRS